MCIAYHIHTRLLRQFLRRYPLVSGRRIPTLLLPISECHLLTLHEHQHSSYQKYYVKQRIITVFALHSTLI